MLEVKNRRVVIPFLEDVEITVPKNTITYNREEQTYVQTVSGISQLTLPFSPLCTELTEIYINGQRLVNPRSRRKVGGTIYEKYNVTGNLITFSSVISGSLKIVCDTNPMPEYHSNFIEIDNNQGYLSTGISLFHEPVVLTEPQNGYARLSFFRKELIYVPKLDFVGIDFFSYCIINNHGQQSAAKCIFVTVDEELNYEPSEDNKHLKS